MNDVDAVLTDQARKLGKDPPIEGVPLAELGGVLAVTAWRMNEWHEIRDIFGKRFKSAIFAFVSTLIATVALDLTQVVQGSEKLLQRILRLLDDALLAECCLERPLSLQGCPICRNR